MAFAPNPQNDGAFGGGGGGGTQQIINGGLGITASTVGDTTTIETNLLGGSGIQLLPQVGDALEIATDLSGGTGITITPNGTQQVISTNLVAGNAGITIGSGSSQTISNEGVLSVVAGSGGISVSLGQNPVISSTITITGADGPSTGYVVFPAINSNDDGQGNFTLSPNLYPFSGNFVVPVAGPTGITISEPGQYWILASPNSAGDLQLNVNLAQIGAQPGRYYIFNNNGNGFNNMNIFCYLYGSSGGGSQTVIAAGTQCSPGEGIYFDLTYTVGVNQNAGQVSVIRALPGGGNSQKIGMSPNSQNA